jgi:cytochrome c551/c552
VPKVKLTTAAFIIGAISLPVALFCWNMQAASAKAQENANNGPPVVKIMAPKNNSSYQWNTLVNYSIVVSDQGKSTQYQEIPAKDVLLEATYIPDLSHTNVTSAQTVSPSPAGLQNIVDSNCLGCHEFKARAMGPSFAAVGQRYPDTESTINTLSQHIRDGSQGMWGQASMPRHQDLTEDQVHAIALWIMKDASDPNVNYYVGTEGTFQMEPSGKPGPKGGIILTASCTRPGATTQQQTLRGEDTVTVYGRWLGHKLVVFCLFDLPGKQTISV